MASSLRDIPGANRRTTTYRRRRDPLAPRSAPSILIDPRASLYDGGRRRGRPLRDRRQRRLQPIDLVLIAAVATLVLFLGWRLWSATRVDVDIVGVVDEGAVSFERSEGLEVRITVAPAGRLEASTLSLDGEPLEGIAERTDDGFVFRTDSPMTVGDHRLELMVPRPILPAARFAWDFNVDAVPPTIDIPTTLFDPMPMDADVTIEGTVDTDATLTADGDDVPIDEDGRFTIEYDAPPPGPIVLAATDAAGHETKVEVFAPVERQMTRGVHMTAISWAEDDLRGQVFDMLDRGIINAVELDIKDEGGVVGWNSSNAVAREVGAIEEHYDLRAAVEELHERGAYVIGRVVAFRDPKLAQGAWAAGRKDWVLQGTDGKPFAAYGGFTNFMHDDVRAYNLDLALEAIDAGVDEILWDYIRRPEGDLASMVIPGLQGQVEVAVADFLADAHKEVRAAGALQGASVFGVATLEPESIGQSIPRIARTVDYIAPMVYPSLWGPGQHRVPDPPRDPFAIVTRSVQDFLKKSRGTGVGMVPWLQDFSLGGAQYGPAQVRAQVEATYGLGLDSWLLWSPRVRYNPEQLEPIDG
jgi:hypothetical protein